MFKSLRDRLKKVSSELEENLEERLEAELDAELEAELAGVSTEEPEAAPEQAPESTPGPSPEQSTDADDEPTLKDTEDAVSDEPIVAPEPPVETSEQDADLPPEPAEAVPESEPPKTAPIPAAQPPTEKSALITGRKMLSEDEVAARLERELGEAVAVQKEVEQAVEETGKARYSINEDVLEDILWELEVGLLESDVALPVIEAIKGDVQEQLLSMKVGGRNPGEVVENVLRSAIRRVLRTNALDFDSWLAARRAEKKPVVIMFVGVNGTGKTTSIARLAYRLQQQGISSVLAAGDTFRAGAIEQLSQHGDALGIKVIKHNAGADPAAVAYDAIEHAKARRKDVVLLDTAGRMQTNSNLMDEMDKIRRVAKPDMTLFVGDSLAGNDAVEQARRFDEVVDVDGAILTKTDVDAKGGAALSVAYTIQKPLLFIGVGQDYPDLEAFDAQTMVDRLFSD